MTFNEWWTDSKSSEKIKLENESGISRNRLSQIAHGHSNPSIKTAIKIIQSVNSIDRKAKIKLSGIIVALENY